MYNLACLVYSRSLSFQKNWFYLLQLNPYKNDE